MDLNGLKQEKDKNNGRRCSECLHIQRPYRKDLNDTVYCYKTLKLIDLNSSCPHWQYYGKE
jgi:hypothetical protein